MFRINEQMALFKHNGTPVIDQPIQKDEDLLIETTCIFLSPLRTSGQLRAQYSLICLGEVAAQRLVVNDRLICMKDVTASEIEVGNELNVSGVIKCDRLKVSGRAFIGELGCGTLEAGDSVIVEKQLDATDDILVKGSVLCLDNIICDGVARAANIITVNEMDIHEREANQAISLKSFDGCLQTKPATIAGEDVASIHNFDSPLAVAMEDFALFVENAIAVCGQRDPLSARALLRDYAAYITTFAVLDTLCHRADATFSLVEKSSPGNMGEYWFDAFIAASDFIAALERDLKESPLYEEAVGRAQKLSELFQQCVPKTRSAGKWARCLAEICRLRDEMALAPARPVLDAALRELYRNIGINANAVKIYFPQN